LCSILMLDLYFCRKYKVFHLFLCVSIHIPEEQTVCYYFKIFHPMNFHILGIWLMTSIKCTHIYYISIPCSSYMFWCVLHHHQGQLLFFVLKPICFIYSYYLCMNSGCIIKYKGWKIVLIDLH